MTMADDDATDAPAETPEEETREAPAEKTGATAAGKGRLFIILCAAVAFLAAAAGYAVALLTTGQSPLAPAAAEAGQGQAPAAPSGAEAGDAAVPPPATADTEKLLYKDLESITVNLDEPQLARYVHATITLGIDEKEFEQVAPQIDAKLLVLRDWLTVYLTSLSLEDVRGSANLNRIRREILDAFNEQLWPGGKPMIRKVLFKDFAIK
jgi:flagellar basal body-associated protein FliL